MNDGGAVMGTFGQLAESEPYPGIRRRTVEGSQATVSMYLFDPGAEFPLHRHPQEQITLVEAGSVQLRLANRIEQLQAPAWSVIPGGVEHGITAHHSGARVVAIIAPARDSADPYEVVRDRD